MGSFAAISAKKERIFLHCGDSFEPSGTHRVDTAVLCYN